ncbi:nucleotidyltransferase [Sinomicrobium kalidii]|uniref:nucleotidyltransferase n=1 Tax=Sinomicrobium kalidii TaxID=2900738 RepID=UPI001E61D4C5|nr:nucleotidyltransferase [Sinomicrobium kalidii]UGU15222.1 nucleotidyltransferase [Sinomicrobium kalidii]
MARSIGNIQDEIITAVQDRQELREHLTSDSKLSIWRLWVYIVAFAIWTLEKLFDLHREEVDRELELLKPHTARWYREKALAFQYGYQLIPDSDRYDNSELTDEELEASRIIKYAAVVEAISESRLIVKIATRQGDVLQPITPTQKEAFDTYVNAVKDAGVNITVINYLPDQLRLSIRIFRDPLLLDANGTHRVTGRRPVEDALQEYMKELPFNGELVIQELANKLENAEGVKIVQADRVETRWIDVDSGTYGAWEPIDVRAFPQSGYFEIENFNGISYVV